MRRALHLVLAVSALLAVTGCARGDDVGTSPARRVLVVSMPGVSWDDVRSGSLPKLEAFADDAAVANLATRIGRREGSVHASYLTLGAGTRAVAPVEGPGVALEPGESYHGEPSVDVLRRRLGEVPTGVAYLAIGAARDANTGSAFGADVGTLGDALARAGVHRAVVANADLREGRGDDEAYGRSAVAVLMGSDGLVPEGTVARSLLVDDPDVPYGVALDVAAVAAAVESTWAGDERAAVLVEASDLVRATEYGRSAAPDQRSAMRDDALERTDDLFGGLLDEIGPDDAVVVVAPVGPRGAPNLGIAALRAPGVDGGLLRSATTRRDGYVQLADVAPTVLALLGEEAPDDVEGRPFRVAEADGDRLDRLAGAGRQAGFRDAIVPPVVTALIAFLALLLAATVLRHRLPPRMRRALPVLATAALGALPATFLSATLGVGSNIAFWALVLAGAAAVAGVAALADRWRPGIGAIVAVAVVVGVIAVDVAVGAPLQINTVFGYSVAVAGRFAGLGNLAFALFAAGGLVLAMLVAERGHRLAALVILVTVVLVDGLPILGADVGGILSTVPAFVLAALVLLGRRIGWREVGAAFAAAAGLLLVSAFLDLARPAAARTHLARLAEHVLDRRWEPLLDSLTRRWSASFGGGQAGAWVVLAVLAAVVGTYVLLAALWRTRPVPTAPALERPEAAGAVGLAVLAGLGLVANDSSFAVPATMLLVVVPALIHRTVTRELPA